VSYTSRQTQGSEYLSLRCVECTHFCRRVRFCFLSNSLTFVQFCIFRKYQWRIEKKLKGGGGAASTIYQLLRHFSLFTMVVAVFAEHVNCKKNKALKIEVSFNGKRRIAEKIDTSNGGVFAPSI